MTIYLIRHGNKEAVPFDPPLTAVGIKQAEITAKLLKKVNINAIFSSPKERTRRTAEIVAKPHSLPIVFDNRLLERLEWESKVFMDDFLVEWIKTDFNRDYIPKDGKSSVENGIEIKQVLDELSLKYKNGNILIVTHGGTIGDLLRQLFGEANLPHEINFFTKAPHIKISECSLTIIEKSNEKYNLVTLNDTTHLSSL